MLTATQALVLHTTPYADTSVIAKIFTRELGVRSYIVKGVRSPHGRVKMNLLQPFSHLDLVVYDNAKRPINYIKDIHHHAVPRPTTPIDIALAFFYTEVAYKVLKDDEVNAPYFDYLAALPHSALPAAHLPVNFLLHTAHHLGLAPRDNSDSRHPVFDMKEGRYVAAPTENTLSAELSDVLHRYLVAPVPAVSSEQRRQLVNALLLYFQLHLDTFRHFNSNEILHNVLN